MSFVTATWRPRGIRLRKAERRKSANKYDAESSAVDSGRSSMRLLGTTMEIVDLGKSVLTKLLTNPVTGSIPSVYLRRILNV